MLVVISDFYEEPGTVLDAVKLLRYRGNDVVLFHVLDPAEIDFSYDQATSFQDLESGEQLPVVPLTLREQYQALVQEHIAALGTRCNENRIDYALFNTSQPLDEGLFKYLSTREKLLRIR